MISPALVRSRAEAALNSRGKLRLAVGETRCRESFRQISTLATPIRGNILATSISSDASNTSRKPDDMDDLDAGGSIYTFCTRLRALSGVSRVVVRVHSGALDLSGSVRRTTQTRGDSRVRMRLAPCVLPKPALGFEADFRAFARAAERGGRNPEAVGRVRS
jgi:hypothetical protein